MDQGRANQFLQEVSTNLDPQVMVLDEAAFFWNHVREHAWSKRGSRAVIPRPGIRGKAHSLLLCISVDGVIKWQLYEGAVDSVRFLEFVQTLPPGTLILDNARIHHATHSLRRLGRPTIAEATDAIGLTLKYLPPYAPVLNPVELCFNSIRTYVNRIQPRTPEDLITTITAAVESLTADVCDLTINRVWCS